MAMTCWSASGAWSAYRKRANALAAAGERVGSTVAKRQKKSGSGFLAGLIIGVAIGATVVWVLTPQPREIEAMRATRANRASRASAVGVDGLSDLGAASATGAASGAADGAAPTILDLAMAAVERVRTRFGDAMTLGREAYEQGQTEVMQRFNQARTAE